jgi:hypothetical protein
MICVEKEDAVEEEVEAPHDFVSQRRESRS